jgi:ring-1,2-phenylacetyl-CoA epoxidase subunit PaaD
MPNGNMTVKTDIDNIYKLLESVKDPEIPVLSVRDLGILRNVEIEDDGKVVVTITPTYSGCPAMDTIEREVKEKLEGAGLEVEVKTQISPAWTTDWMTKEGRKKREQYGIAPPAETTADKASLLGKKKTIRCPRCKSENTKLISQFGSTACKALYRCEDCDEPFDYFKCI